MVQIHHLSSHFFSYPLNQLQHSRKFGEGRASNNFDIQLYTQYSIHAIKKNQDLKANAVSGTTTLQL